MTQLEQVANVIEKMAYYLDAVEAEKINAERVDRQKLAALLKEKYEELTGDTIDEDALGKLANADVDILAAFDKLAQTRVSSEMGEPADRRDSSNPMTVKEAAEAADDRLLDFILGE